MNDECRNPNDERNPNFELEPPAPDTSFGHSSFGLPSDFVIRNSGFDL